MTAARSAALALALLVSLAACATMQSVREDYDKMLSDYNDVIRWKGFEAGGGFVTETFRKEYLERARQAKDVRVTEVRVLDMKYNPDKGEARATVEYQYYVPSSNRVNTVVDEQKWVHMEDGGEKLWRLTTLPPSFK